MLTLPFFFRSQDDSQGVRLRFEAHNIYPGRIRKGGAVFSSHFSTVQMTGQNIVTYRDNGFMTKTKGRVTNQWWRIAAMRLPAAWRIPWRTRGYGSTAATERLRKSFKSHFHLFPLLFSGAYCFATSCNSCCYQGFPNLWLSVLEVVCML